MIRQYEKDPINGKFYPKMEEYISEEQWEALQKRWGKPEERPEEKKPCFTGVHAFWISFFVSFYLFALMKIWGLIW